LAAGRQALGAARLCDLLSLGFVDPQFGGGMGGFQLFQQRSDIRGVDDQRPVRLTDEAIGNSSAS